MHRIDVNVRRLRYTDMDNWIFCPHTVALVKSSEPTRRHGKQVLGAKRQELLGAGYITLSRADGFFFFKAN